MRALFIVLMCSSSAQAAANLAMSSATIGADGITVTIPFTGTCQTPLSPASGILGFSVSVTPGGWAGSISTATRSGCTVTLVLSEPVSVDETLTVTLASTTGAGYLTDNAGNTPAGQSGFPTTNNSGWDSVDGPSMSGKYQAEGSNTTGTTYTYQVNFLSADGCYRINATATQIDLFAFNYSNHWVLRQDGVTIHDWGAGSASAIWTEQGLVTGLSGSHEYDFCAINPQNNGPFYASVARIRVTGTLGSQPTVKAIIAAGGDSITAYFGPQPATDSTLGDLYQVASQLGLADQFYGNPGAQVCAMDSSVPPFLVFSGSFPLAFLAGSSGYNDYSVGTSAATLGACWDTFLTNMDNLSNPPTHIVVEGMLPFVSAIPGAYDTAIAAAVALHPRACFVSRLNWIDTVAWTGSTGDRQSDQVHIHPSSSGTGYAKVANRELPIASGYISGQSFTATPTNGVAATIQLTLPGTATWIDQITATSSNAADYLCFSSTCGTHSVTLPASTGTNAVNLIVNGSVGSRTVTYSSLANCWTAPSPTTLTLIQATYSPIGEAQR